MRKSNRSPMLPLVCAALLLATLPARATPPHGTAPGGGHSTGLPIPPTTLLADEARVPFVLPETFPVPVVEVRLNGTGPWRLAVDTAMSGTVLLRKGLVAQMGLPVVGHAVVGDSSGTNRQQADLVRIDSMRVGDLEVQEVIGIGFAAGAAHLSEVPEDIHGILGNRIYAELLMTLDYPARTITFRSGELAAADPSVIGFDDQGDLMTVEMDLAGLMVQVTVDTGSRGSITLPRSMASKLPLRGELREIAPVSTVAHTYRREAAPLDGTARLADSTLVEPEIGFADEHTPKLIGYGILKHFVITIDQAHGRLRWEKAAAPRAHGTSAP